MIDDARIFHNFKALIFDLDGTLIDSEPWHVKAWNDVLAENNLPLIDYEYILTVGGIKSSEICRMMLEKAGRTDLDPVKTAQYKTEVYRKKYLQHVPFFDSISAYLRKAYALGLKTAIATGSQLPETRELLSRHHLLEYVQTIVSSDQVKNCKPAPDTYLIAAERLDIAPCDCLVFEDTKVGLQGIKAAGMTALQVKDGKIISDFLV